MGVDERPLLQAESMPGEGEGRNQGIQSFQFSQDANEGGSELGCQPEVVVLEEGCPGEEEGEEAKDNRGGREVGLDGGGGEGAGGKVCRKSGEEGGGEGEEEEAEVNE
eukprot:evm.model.NODE_8667_length_1051_cov_30.080875.1